MPASRTSWNLRGTRQAQGFAALVAAEAAGIADFTASIQTGLVLLSLKSTEIKPGLVRGMCDHFDKSILHEGEIKA